MAVIENTPQAWSERAKKGRSWDAAMWSQEGQQERFTAVLNAIRPQRGETLLDFGCGTGAFAEALPAGVQYLGYDWATGMIERAEREHVYRDFTTHEPTGVFDFVVCIGPFNLRDNWTKEQTWEKLPQPSLDQ